MREGGEGQPQAEREAKYSPTDVFNDLRKANPEAARVISEVGHANPAAAAQMVERMRNVGRQAAVETLQLIAAELGGLQKEGSASPENIMAVVERPGVKTREKAAWKAKLVRAGDPSAMDIDSQLQLQREQAKWNRLQEQRAIDLSSAGGVSPINTQDRGEQYAIQQDAQRRAAAAKKAKAYFGGASEV